MLHDGEKAAPSSVLMLEEKQQVPSPTRVGLQSTGKVRAGLWHAVWLTLHIHA